ncbi:MAG: hypothetical protein JSU87_03590 [Gemmatimonadota bacterium]|nr:MAG: hypothetical protein JSU87_03590 [Gemmatimonadota bacterium]
MNQRKQRAVALAFLAALLTTSTSANAQLAVRETLGQFYRVEFPLSTDRLANSLQVELIAPNALAANAPIAALPLGASIQALTGQIVELPERQLIFLPAIDGSGAVRLFALDLLYRQVGEIRPPPGSTVPYAVRLLAAPENSKVYVQWFSAGSVPATDIYDGETLHWLGSTTEFLPDERAAGFQHRSGLLWTLDPANRPLLIDVNGDRVVARFDPQRWFGPVRCVVADAWRDLLLIRQDIGHDRFQLVDAVSGEIGPPLDLPGYAPAQPRLVLDGRFLALIDRELVPLRRGPWRELAIAVGSGSIYDLRSGELSQRFRLGVPPELPVAALGTHSDPSAPGRLWVHVPGDHQRFDLGVRPCDNRSAAGDVVAAGLDVRWEATHPSLYRYRVSVDRESAAAVGVVAVRAGRWTARTGAPAGWGTDLLDRERWVRWSNGLGPDGENVAPGTRTGGFVIEAEMTSRPTIVDYRMQAALGLPRACESDQRFLENSRAGYTVGPERVDTADPRELSRRLERLVARACSIGWIGTDDCPDLRARAARLSRLDAGALEDLRSALAQISLTRDAAVILTDAVAAVAAALIEPQP